MLSGEHVGREREIKNDPGTKESPLPSGQLQDEVRRVRAEVGPEVGHGGLRRPFSRPGEKEELWRRQ